MERARIIPILTISGRKLVKTVRFKKPNYLGDPINTLKLFNDKMVDEILILDIIASRQRTEPNYALVHEMAGECFSPLGYGGGISNFEQAQKVFACGVEKVVINTATHTASRLISELAQAYGSQSIVVCIDVKKSRFRGSRVHFRSGTESQSGSVTAFAKQMEDRGAGELIIQQTDRDGTFMGLDRELTRSVVQAVSVPVIACGGAASITDMTSTIAATGASAAAAASVFVYKGQNTQSILISYPTPDDILVR